MHREQKQSIYLNIQALHEFKHEYESSVSFKQVFENVSKKLGVEHIGIYYSAQEDLLMPQHCVAVYDDGQCEDPREIYLTDVEEKIILTDGNGNLTNCGKGYLMARILSGQDVPLDHIKQGVEALQLLTVRSIDSYLRPKPI